MILGITEEGST